jgi:hypothetical protein
MAAFPTPIQYSFGIPSQSNKTRARNKRHSNRERRIKLSLIADDMILYLRNTKNSTKKLLEIINSCNKVAGCKINIQKSVAFVYTNNAQI